MNAWILGWLGIGVAVLVVDVLELRRQRREAAAKWGPAARLPFDGPMAIRLAGLWLAIGLFGAFSIVVWPVMLGHRLWRHWRFRRGAVAPDGTRRPFAVDRRDLLAAATRAAIEAAEVVRDPLGGAPELPFGHLNAAWRRFADALPPDAVLHAFRSDWRNEYGRRERHEGYVAVVGGVPGAHFATRVPRLVEPRQRS